ncbi:hypothetical protein GQ44DRAFT_205405 [Phaeosphaeriaceae sp. PMI808]|nr:hypothetical protein GQ44DRAFT_205405 [Phaeosphaeriaceae sp. PMI808]
MATAYYYAAHFNAPLNQSSTTLTAHHPFGISTHALDLPMTPATSQRQENKLSETGRRILFANGKIDQQQDSPFFRLPAELRNQIYEELLCPEITPIKQLAQRNHHLTPTPPLYPSILSTCRKAHEEATDLLYSTAVFHAHPSLLASLPHLTSPAAPVLYPSMLAKIRRWQLALRLDTDPQFTMAQATASFSGAEYLEIRVWQSQFGCCDSSVLRLFLGIRGVRVAKVVGSANAELARWLEGRMMMARETEVGVVEERCRCGNESGVVRCGQCCKKVVVDGEWFAPRNVWQYGNR